MRGFLRLTILIAFAIVLAFPVQADSLCSAGSTCSVLLTTSNISELAGVVVTVTIDNTGPNTLLSFQLTTNPLTNTPLGIDQIGWNATLVQVGTKKRGQITVPVYGPDLSALSSSSSNYGGRQGATVNGSGNMSAFGTFNVQAQDPAGTGGISSPITFTLAGLVTNFPSNPDENDFVVHMRYDTCSGWVGGPGGPDAAATSDSGCTPIPPPPPPNNPVPEPGSLVLFGTGLIGLAGMLRRRLIG